MIVNCDKCGAKFQLADDKVTDKGTKVRCSKCKAIFTVKKGDEKAAPGPAPVAAKPAAPAAPPAPAKAEPGKKGDDPFSDFNFSDDLDFGDQEINVKPKTEEPEKGFLDSVPSAPIPPKAAAPAPAAPADDGGFDFSDEEFSLSEPEPPKPAAKPAPPPPPPKPAAPAKPAASPPKPAAKKAEADEFGDFKFDDESFSEPSGKAPAAAAPRAGGGASAGSPAGGPGGGASEEWGNVSIGDVDPHPKTKAGAEEMDDNGFGDFKFDDGSGSGSEKDDEIDVDSFRRSEKSKAPVRDDLEASIGDGDSEPEARPAPRKTEAPEPPPLPPKPVIKMDKKAASGGRGWVKFVIIGVVFLAIVFGGVGYTNSQGWFSFGDLFTLKFKKLGDIPAVNQWLIDNGYREVPNTGSIEVADKPKAEQVVREDLGVTMIVITGQVANRTNKVQTGIKIQAGLKNQNGDIVATAYSYCGVAFSEEELKTMSRQGIEDITSMSSGRDMKCMEVEPGTVLPFTIVFFDYPSDGGSLKVSAPQVVESKVLGE